MERRYIAPSPPTDTLLSVVETKGSHRCSISDERLAFEAVRAVISKDLAHVGKPLATVRLVLTVEEYPNENLYGRAGTLYLLRMVRHWAPESISLVNPVISELCDRILAAAPAGKWHGRRYLGAVHGDSGIIIRLVMATPELATRLRPILDRLLDMQLPDGNWPSAESNYSGSTAMPGLVQFCHGAPGVVESLLSLPPHFPELWGKIDGAIDKGRECIRSQGMLLKEPSLCHRLVGNALTLPPGSKRNYFLAFATPENVANVRMSNPPGTIFVRADYGRSYSTLTSYAPAAMWVWMVWRENQPTIFCYDDI
ncbi:hypothetical protein B0T24DRAFT_533198 [Lasiosphaeria ovina]|uniref:Uncharacterized protein n=1 Tax=Lasiosphaeria ovina TaxID=92902 RepID=A0AAE0N541_9PEZI|nr:hypothetical protein B0T24DRAFT_533198 [Lasiosphaeria ovina]